MCSYNALNGGPTCADPYLLQTILRERWGWTNEDQYITSDWDAIQDIYMPHNYASTREQAVADALITGTHLNCGTYCQSYLPSAYNEGLFNESAIDRALIRQYSALVKVGYFDPASATPYRSLDFTNVSTPYAESLALKAAEEGIVLLKNDGTLPLSLPTTGNISIALIGSWANATTQMQGNYFGIPPFLHSPLHAAQRLPGVTVNYAAGVGSQGGPAAASWQTALSAANTSEIIIVADGIDAGVEGRAWTAIPSIGQLHSRTCSSDSLRWVSRLSCSRWATSSMIARFWRIRILVRSSGAGLRDKMAGRRS